MMATWHTLRVTHYASPDRLIVEAVEPLFATVRPHVAGAYFIRHWRQGPHVRLNFLCSAEIFRDVVEAHAHAQLGEYLRRVPSTTTIDRERLAALHQRLARDERELGPLTPWIPDNTLRRMEYDGRRHVLGEAEVDMLETFYDRTTDLSFDMTRAVVDGASRARMAFDLMVATAQALSGATIERGFVSLRSHSEAFLSYSTEGDALRDNWARYYAQNSTSLRGRLRTVLAALADGSESVPFVRRWLDLVLPLKKRAENLIAQGRMTLDVADPPASGPRIEPPPTGRTAYHEWMVATRPDRTLVESAGWFLAYRWVLNCAYLHLTRIGLAPVERYLLCTVVADAVEDEFGVAAFDVARRVLGDARNNEALAGKGGDSV